MAEDVTPRIISLFADTYGLDGITEAWGEFRCCDTKNDRGTLLEFTPQSPLLELFLSWLAHNWTPMMLSKRLRGAAVCDQVPAQTFLELHPELDPLLIKYVKACIETPFSFFEVLGEGPGRRLTCWDLLRGGQQLMLENGFSPDLRKRHILYARIVEVDDATHMDVDAPWPLPAEDLRPAILALRKMIMEHPSGAEPACARQRLLAYDSDVRRFYWGFIEEALHGGAKGRS